MASGGNPKAATENFDSGSGTATTGVSGGGATAYNDQGVATGRAAQGAPGGQGGSMPGMPGMPPQMQSKMEDVKSKVLEQGEKQKQ